MARAFTDDGLTIRAYRADDAEALASAVNESYEHLKPWMAWASATQTPEETRERIQSMTERAVRAEDYTLGIFDDRGYIGGTGFHPRLGVTAYKGCEIGMWIRASRAGSGVGSRVLKAMLAWGFSRDWEWERLVWRCDSDNFASARVAEKCGLRLEGVHLQESLGADGLPRDIKWYAILRSEYNERNPDAETSV